MINILLNKKEIVDLFLGLLGVIIAHLLITYMESQDPLKNSMFTFFTVWYIRTVGMNMYSQKLIKKSTPASE